ncbi:MAG: hypothetical protein IT206_05015 [Fimbriimonadaceae bacterium]|nr:hypothetical protein [Fimbriimonadaceae bacterium]
MSKERATQIAVSLMRLGVSKAGIAELFKNHSYEDIELQLRYLPYRKAKRPEAFIMEAVRHNYSAPKELFHAKTETDPSSTGRAVDEGAQHLP